MDKDKYEIVFINDYATALLTAAFDAVSAYENLSAKRLDAAEVMMRYSTRPSKRTCFVFCRFEGECFEHLRSLGAAIYGPQIILHYIRENQPLPRVHHPLYSTALMRAVATVTSVTGSEREYLLSSIQMLHGQASRDLFDGINVVITPKVGSKKYLVGSSRGVNMLLPSWITEAWKLSAIQDPIDMMLPTFTERFRVPIFAQLVICVSGLSAEERKEVSDLVVKHGGRYSGMMKVGETTHLIIKHPSGLKYAHAKKWKIQIVSVNWLTDSVSKGYALDEVDYRVSESIENSSTPTCENNRRSFSFDNMSMISHTTGTTTRIDESRVDARSAESFLHRSSTAPAERPILSDCLIQLIECNREEHFKYASLVKELGGRLCTDLQDRVTEPLTHAVVGSLNASGNVTTMEKEVAYVRGSWLISCHETHRRVPESEHLVKSVEPVEAEEPTMTDGLDSDDKTKRTMDTEDLQLINQYFGAGGLADVDDFNRENTVQQNASKVETRSSHGVPETHTLCEPHASGLNSTVAVRTGCFSGFSFFLHEEIPASDKLGVLEVVRDAGGQITEAIHAANFLVTPFFIRSNPKMSQNTKMVTVSWIDHCIAASTICWDDLIGEKAFMPLVRSGPLPLDGCVISLSGFVGYDRVLLTRYSRALGAIVQDYFLCKAVPSRNLAASTHLVAAKLEGRKCPAAKQWGLPVVNRNWLYACADQWKLADTGAYPVEDPSIISKPNFTEKSAPSDPPKDRRLTEIQQNVQPQIMRSTNETKATPPTKVRTPVNLGSAPSKSATDALCTPDWVQNHSDHTIDINNSLRDSFGQPCRPSPPLSEQVARCLKKAVVRTAALPKRKLDLSGKVRMNLISSIPILPIGLLVQFHSTTDDGTEELPLKDVVICVAKHLSSRQVELNGVAKQLGGDFKWTYDPQICTHIVAEYQNEDGRTPYRVNDQTPVTPSPQPNLYADVLAAKQDGRCLVHPRWLTACLAASRRLPESEFPPGPSPSPRSRPEEDSPTTEPACKILRTASSNLLGDVNRRLELMLGCTNKATDIARAGDVDATETAMMPSKSTTHTGGPRGPPQLNSPLREDVELVGEQAAVLFLGDTSTSGPRRLRRNTRRIVGGPALPNGASTPIANANRGANPEELVGEAGGNRYETVADRAQPGQSLMVRWQYEDAPPRSPIDGTAANTEITGNHRGMRSPTPTNPGQGIVGIDHLTSRDVLRRDLSSTSAEPPSRDAHETTPMQPPPPQQTSNTAKSGSVTTVVGKRSESSRDLNPVRPVISFSGLATDERDQYAAIVADLGGEVDNQLTLSEKATHLIVHTPTRSEKCLICLSSGRWMLHKSYLDACVRESRWVDETPYEWGGPGTEPLLMQLSPAVSTRVGHQQQQQQKQQAAQIRELARSARRWRMVGGEAFKGWRVIFGPGCDKEASFRRVIESGGGQILSSQPPYPPPTSVTHSFAKRRPNNSNAPLPRGYQWLRIDYLCAYLIAGQEVPRDDFLIS
ncbi:hypothetical protein FGIG_11559 [Fasciola gigantica]|uniref:BRCT domain-containing protein n=1 Tax=Fasciola gigantica TaxID=46835 RepID=A0A504YNB2_FASGI|nr:hypothetical protein FGIG_11559 [Fasciola gigantica]